MEGQRDPRRHWVPILILIAGLVMTGVAAAYAWRASEMQNRLRFENAADDVRNSLTNRIDEYIAMLRGGAGFFAASHDVTAAEFRAYAARLELAERYPGIQGIGFSRRIHASEREAVLARLGQDGVAISFWPDQPGRDIHAIVYLEPLDARNRLAIGYDMSSEPDRREAMARACDTAAPAASGRVRLVQERADPASQQAGFLIYLPVYRGGAVPIDIQMRRDDLFGFVYAPFRADDLLHGTLGSMSGLAASLEVYDGDPAPDRLLYRSGPPPASAPRLQLGTTIGGRPWTLRLHGRSELLDPISSGLVLLIAMGGTLISVLLFATTSAEIRARESAERTANELRGSEEALRAAHAAKDEFLAVVSHELRTPLNAIVGWAAMLRKGTVAPGQQAHALDVIARNAAAQTLLVDDLLDLSSAIAGRLRLQPTEVDVAIPLGAALDSVRPSADAAGVRLEWHSAHDLGTIRADAARLQQIFLNLLSNAIKFTPRGGVVTLTADRDWRAVVLRVADTGVGIAPGFLPFVFDRFRQADTSSTRAHPGMGLGLAIARHLVRLHGGTITVESAGLDQGTTFTVTLPLHPPAAAPAPA